LPPAFKKTIHDKDDALAKACINKQQHRNAGPNGAAKQSSSLISEKTIAYFCGKINHLAITMIGPWLAVKI